MASSKILILNSLWKNVKNKNRITLFIINNIIYLSQFATMSYQKLNKIQPLENPFHKSITTVTTGTKSELFLLNDRSKVILDD